MEEVDGRGCAGEKESQCHTQKEETAVIDDLRQAGIFPQGDEVLWIFAAEERGSEQDAESAVDYSHFQVNHAAEVRQVAGKNIFRCEEKRGDVVLIDGEEPFLENEQEQRQPGREGAENEKNSVGQKRNYE